MLSVLILPVLLGVAPTFVLWPLPRHITPANTAPRFNLGFSIRYSGIGNAPKDPIDAATRTRNFLRHDKLRDHGASSANHFFIPPIPQAP